ncbi:hypothetical protein FB451DRAFT_1563676 [Mycena latifolia]|nr:hypothetical protein FB451DRAFT_1563676 [Mycena latifolia]
MVLDLYLAITLTPPVHGRLVPVLSDCRRRARGELSLFFSAPHPQEIRWMGSWPLALLLLFCALLQSTYTADPDVFPDEDVVPQCSTLTVLWSQPPPIHLHVQPGSLINVTNLFDLGPQLNNTFTTFTVALPIAQNFSFAYNTIKNPFTVFVSREMQVGPGTTDCLNPSSSAGPSSSAPLSSSAAPSSSATPSSTTLVPPPTQSAASDSASSQRAFPVGPVVGAVCAVAGIVLILLAIFFFWYRPRERRRAENERDYAPAPEVRAPLMSVAPAPMFLGGAQHQPGGSISPYQESVGGSVAPYQESMPTSTSKSRRMMTEQSVSGAGFSDTETSVSPLISSTMSGMASPQSAARTSHLEEAPPAYH